MNITRRTPSSLAPYRPRLMEDQFGRLVENMFEDMFAPLAHGALAPWSGDTAISPRMEVSESDQAFEVKAELPGVKKDDVKVTIERQRVTIEGESKREQERRESENLLYSERRSTSFMRSFSLPVEVDEAGAQARIEDGVLTLTLPKKQGSTATRVSIQ